MDVDIVLIFSANATIYQYQPKFGRWSHCGALFVEDLDRTHTFFSLCFLLGRMCILMHANLYIEVITYYLFILVFYIVMLMWCIKCVSISVR